MDLYDIGLGVIKDIDQWSHDVANIRFSLFFAQRSDKNVLNIMHIYSVHDTWTLTWCILQQSATVHTDSPSSPSAELPPLGAGWHRRVRPGGLQAAAVHRRGHGPLLGARTPAAQLLLRFPLLLLLPLLVPGAPLPDLPGLRVGPLQVLLQFPGGAHHHREAAHRQRWVFVDEKGCEVTKKSLFRLVSKSDFRLISNIRPLMNI